MKVLIYWCIKQQMIMYWKIYLLWLAVLLEVKVQRCSLASKETWFSFIPKLRDGVALAQVSLCTLIPIARTHTHLFNQSNSMAQTFDVILHVSIKMSISQFYFITLSIASIPLPILWLWEATGRSSSEEVKVCYRVHLYIIEIDFVVWSAVHLDRHIYWQEPVLNNQCSFYTPSWHTFNKIISVLRNLFL